MRASVMMLCLSTSAAPALAQAPAAWDSVARILQTPAAPAAGYTRYNFPRRDLTVRVGDVTVAPAVALGGWVGFAGDPAAATMMGDLVVTSEELSPVLAEAAREDITVTAIHNHLVGESPRVLYVHVMARGAATALAQKMDRVLARTAAPRPVTPATPAPVTIDTALVFSVLGQSGRAQGNVAQVGFMLVPGTVTVGGQVATPALAYASPINIQMVDATRAVAAGDLAIPGAKVDGVLHALAAHGITATAVHSHLIDMAPPAVYIHFWADGPLRQVLEGLRAAVDAAR